ncbi:MAG: hypothetical protein OJF52_003948 [Nitrospira sp.]|jgi:hypothetical protein|nr:MAG: hypothetical protein OJF52_003948 [Nitrospira sp.]
MSKLDPESDQLRLSEGEVAQRALDLMLDWAELHREEVLHPH